MKMIIMLSVRNKNYHVTIITTTTTSHSKDHLGLVLTIIFQNLFLHFLL